jgi:hypothetical protein
MCVRVNVMTVIDDHSEEQLLLEIHGASAEPLWPLTPAQIDSQPLITYTSVLSSPRYRAESHLTHYEVGAYWVVMELPISPNPIPLAGLIGAHTQQLGLYKNGVFKRLYDQIFYFMAKKHGTRQMCQMCIFDRLADFRDASLEVGPPRIPS